MVLKIERQRPTVAAEDARPSKRVDVGDTGGGSSEGESGAEDGGAPPPQTAQAVPVDDDAGAGASAAGADATAAPAAAAAVVVGGEGAEDDDARDPRGATARACAGCDAIEGSESCPGPLLLFEDPDEDVAAGQADPDGDGEGKR